MQNPGFTPRRRFSSLASQTHLVSACPRYLVASCIKMDGLERNPPFYSATITVKVAKPVGGSSSRPTGSSHAARATPHGLHTSAPVSHDSSLKDLTVSVLKGTQTQVCIQQSLQPIPCVFSTQILRLDRRPFYRYTCHVPPHPVAHCIDMCTLTLLHACVACVMCGTVCSRAVDLSACGPSS